MILTWWLTFISMQEAVKVLKYNHSIVGGTSKTLANNINEEVKKIVSSRGIKTKLDSNNRDYFAIIRETEAPAVLLEGGFVDNKKDADFIKKNYKKLAEAYAKGIVKTLGIKEKPYKLPVMDNSGSKKGDANSAVLNLKELLLLAKKIGLHKYGMDKNEHFGDGMLRAVNSSRAVGLFAEWHCRRQLL